MALITSVAPSPTARTKILSETRGAFRTKEWNNHGVRKLTWSSYPSCSQLYVRNVPKTHPIIKEYEYT